MMIMMSMDHFDDDDADKVVDLPDEKLQALFKEAKVLYDSYIKVRDSSIKSRKLPSNAPKDSWNRVAMWWF